MSGGKSSGHSRDERAKAADAAISSLRFERVVFAYEGGAPVLDDVTFDFPVGTAVFISGPARQGRSTILRLLAGLEAPGSGRYLLNERDVAQMSFEEFLPWRKRIGFSFDFGGLLANRTLWQNLMLPLEYHRTLGADEAADRVASICRAFGLWDERDARPASVSGGSRKACAVARAFVMDPEMILLDDPFVALDAAAASATLEFIADGRARGRLKHLFMTSQDKSWAEQAGCGSVVEVDRKRLCLRVGGMWGGDADLAKLSSGEKGRAS
jgi:ABC-type transporter Mla maintaining outer membrane lipid asymmetry ATPase subunit MlaF